LSTYPPNREALREWENQTCPPGYIEGSPPREHRPSVSRHHSQPPRVPTPTQPLRSSPTSVSWPPVMSPVAPMQTSMPGSQIQVPAQMIQDPLPPPAVHPPVAPPVFQVPLMVQVPTAIPPPQVAPAAFLPAQQDIWAVLSQLAQSVTTTSQSVNTLQQTIAGIQQAQLAPSETTSVASEPLLAEPRSILTPNMDLMRVFKVPSIASSPQVIEHTLMDWRLRFELPLKQERNRQEVKAIFRTISVLLSSVISESIREAIVVSLSRCEELTLLESHGSTYATTWAHQVFLRTHDSQVLAAAHSAALLAAGKPSASNNIVCRLGPGKRISKRRRQKAAGGSGNAS